MSDLSQQVDYTSTPAPPKNPGVRNEKKVLALLQQGRPLTQTGLCRKTRLNSSTISYTVARLREKNLIIEEPGQSRSRGAKPVLIRINPHGRFLIGVEINPSHLSIGLFDFNTQLIDSVQSASSPFDKHQPQAISDLIEITIRGLMGRHKVDPAKTIGIGITLSGSISPDGEVQLSSPLGWKHVPLRTMIQERFSDMRVSVHSTRVRLLSEVDIADQANFRNVLYINIANGVGGSVFLDGKLIQGATGRIAELGHITVDPDGPECGCGNRGCLEALVSGPAITRRIHNDLPHHASILARQIQTDDIPEKVIDLWGQAVAQGDTYARSLCQAVTEQIARVAAIAINCYDPDVVMPAGYVSRAIMPQLTGAIEQAVQHSVFDSEGRTIQIVPARSGEESLIRGVVTAILHEYLNSD